MYVTETGKSIICYLTDESETLSTGVRMDSRKANRKGSPMGCVYILKNEAMPGLIKIGYTSGTAKERAQQLSQPTGIPMPFEVAADLDGLALEHCQKLEAEIHKELNEHRVNPNREFFKYPVADASQLLKKLHTTTLKKARRPRWLKWLPIL